MDLNYGKGRETESLEKNILHRKLIGHLLYISVNTRSNVSAAISILAHGHKVQNYERFSQERYHNFLLLPNRGNDS